MDRLAQRSFCGNLPHVLLGPSISQVSTRHGLTVARGAVSGTSLASGKRSKVTRSSSRTLRGVLGVVGGIFASRSLSLPRRALSCVSRRSTSSMRKTAGPRVAFVIGGPGSGKGTQCERIADAGYVHLSAGDLLRAERERPDSTLGNLIETVGVSGGFVPSDVIAKLLEQAMREAGWGEKQFIIDGYPRSREQLAGWEDVLAPLVDFRFALYLDVHRDEMRRRLLGRAKSSGRFDDNLETIEKRLASFEAETGPLLEHFDSQGLLCRVDGARDVEEVWSDVRTFFDRQDES